MTFPTCFFSYFKSVLAPEWWVKIFSIFVKISPCYPSFSRLTPRNMDSYSTITGLNFSFLHQSLRVKFLFDSAHYGKILPFIQETHSTLNNFSWEISIPPPLYYIFSWPSPVQLLNISGTNKGHRQVNFRNRYRTACALFDFQNCILWMFLSIRDNISGGKWDCHTGGFFPGSSWDWHRFIRICADFVQNFSRIFYS